MERRKKIIEKVFIILVLIVITTNLLTPVIKATLVDDGIIVWEGGITNRWDINYLNLSDDLANKTDWKAEDLMIDTKDMEEGIKKDLAETFNEKIKNIEKENKNGSNKTNLGQALTNAIAESDNYGSDLVDEMSRKRCRW